MTARWWCRPPGVPLRGRAGSGTTDGRRPALEAVSNIAVLEPNAPYARWLEEAGFKKVEAVDIRFHSPIIVAAP